METYIRKYLKKKSKQITPYNLAWFHSVQNLKNKVILKTILLQTPLNHFHYNHNFLFCILIIYIKIHQILLFT